MPVVGVAVTVPIPDEQISSVIDADTLEEIPVISVVSDEDIIGLFEQAAGKEFDKKYPVTPGSAWRIFKSPPL